MSDLISRDALLERFYCEKDVSSTLWGIDGIENLILNAPTVEEKSVVHGEWDYLGPVIATAYGRIVYAKCSNCKEVITFEDGYDKFCPNCGADMRKKVE